MKGFSLLVCSLITRPQRPYSHIGRFAYIWINIPDSTYRSLNSSPSPHSFLFLHQMHPICEFQKKFNFNILKLIHLATTISSRKLYMLVCYREASCNIGKLNEKKKNIISNISSFHIPSPYLNSRTHTQCR